MLVYPVTFFSGAAAAAIFGAPDFTSSQFTPAVGTLFSAAHGLGSKPEFVVAELVCLTATNGYSIGDRIPWMAYSSDEVSGGLGAHISIIGFNTTDIFLTTGSSRFQIPQKSTGVPVNATGSNWALELLAWKNNIPAPDFVSSDFGTPAPNTKFSAPHGLGLTPKLMMAEYECVTAEGNYAVGDVFYNTSVVTNSANATAVDRARNWGYNGVDVFSLISAAAFLDKNSGTNVSPTATNWAFKLKVWDLPAPDFKSSGITPVNGSKISAAHSLTTVDFVLGEIVCNTSEQNWAIGDRMPFNSVAFDSSFGPANNEYGHISGYDTTEAFFIAAADGMRLLDKTTPTSTTGAALTNANWDVELSVWGS